VERKNDIGKEEKEKIREKILECDI